jgi:hypothetical protein
MDMEAESPRTTRRRRIPNDIWEDKRAIITELYQEQNVPLHEVMEILAKDYGFTATFVTLLSVLLSVNRLILIMVHVSVSESIQLARASFFLPYCLRTLFSPHA